MLGLGRCHRSLREFWAEDEDRLYKVVLRAKCGRVEALHAQRFYVDERLAAQKQVAQDLADGRGLEESVSGEPGRVEEARYARRLPDDRVVVWRHLVEAGPPAADTGVGDPRRPPLDHLHQGRDPIVGCLDAEARLLMR